MVLIAFIYGVWGSPTPDQLGWPEMLIGLILIIASLPAVAVLIRNPKTVFFENRQPFIVMMVGLLIGLIGAGISAYALSDMARDILPYLFLFLPFFFHPYISHHDFTKTVILGSVFIGMAFSIRFIIGLDLIALGTGEAFSDTQFSFLANSPLVLFSALMLLYKGGEYISAKNPLKIGQGLLCAGLSLIPITAMLLMQQRATIACIGLFCVFLIFWIFARTPARAIILMSLMAIGLWSIQDSLITILDIFIEKTRQHGLNMRLAEWQAMFEVLATDPLTLLFGKGWGSSFISPAVGNVPVLFTHSLLSMYWLKIGVVGLSLILLYLYGLLHQANDFIFQYPLRALTILMPLMIGIFLYANFKSLGFGIIVLILSISKQFLNKAVQPRNQYGQAEAKEKTIYPVH